MAKRVIKDRAAAKRYFIQGEIDPATGQRTRPSLRDVAFKYGFNRSYIGTRCAKEKWVDEREAYHTETDQKLMEKRSDLEVDELSEITKTRYRLAREYVDQFLELLKKKKIKPSAGMALAFAQEMGAIGDKVHGIETSGETGTVFQFVGVDDSTFPEAIKPEDNGDGEQ